jgi:hypothetical protein
MRVTIVDAIQSLRPNSNWTMIGFEYEGITWLDKKTTIPSKGAIENEIERLQKERDDYEKANAYKSKRAAEYPSIGDQLDALWKGGAAAQQMLAKVQEVKAKYPKPATQDILDALNRK